MNGDLPNTPEATAHGTGVAPSAAFLDIRNLSLGFYEGHQVHEVLHDVSVTISPGEAVGVVGESGSGKTSLALAALRLLPPTARQVNGQITWKGRDLASLSEKEMAAVRGRGISIVLQSPRSSLSPVFTVGHQFLRLLRSRRGLGRSEASEVAQAGLEAVGLGNFDRISKLYPSQLSGGMAQRVLLSMALALDPELLIADEPTSALDAVARQEILLLLQRLQQTRGIALMIISHDLGSVLKSCRRAYVMLKGRIVEEGFVTELLSRPQHVYTKRLVEAAFPP